MPSKPNIHKPFKKAAKVFKPASESWREDKTTSQRGYGSKWQSARKGFLAKHPECAECFRNGKIKPATVVDHIKPHRGDMVLFWLRSNWQALCKRCHDQKTRRGE